MNMTPEQFQHMVWGEPIVPKLPKFERRILIKHGKNITPNTKQRNATIEREQAKLTRGYGKQPAQVNNTIYGKVLDWRCFSRIRGVVTSLNVADSHKGCKVLESVIIRMLTDYPTIHVKLLEWDYNYSNRHAQTYMSAIKYVINSLNHITLEEDGDLDKTILQKLL